MRVTVTTPQPEATSPKLTTLTQVLGKDIRKAWKELTDAVTFYFDMDIIALVTIRGLKGCSK